MLNISLKTTVTDEDGIMRYQKVGFDFTLTDFGGVLPAVGDVIVPPAGGRNPEKVTVYTVEQRFFRPGAPFGTSASLVVSERPGTREESHLIVGGG